MGKKKGGKKKGNAGEGGEQGNGDGAAPQQEKPSQPKVGPSGAEGSAPGQTGPQRGGGSKEQSPKGQPSQGGEQPVGGKTPQQGDQSQGRGGSTQVGGPPPGMQQQYPGPRAAQPWVGQPQAQGPPQGMQQQYPGPRAAQPSGGQPQAQGMQQQYPGPRAAQPSGGQPQAQGPPQGMQQQYPGPRAGQPPPGMQQPQVQVPQGAQQVEEWKGGSQSPVGVPQQQQLEDTKAPRRQQRGRRNQPPKDTGQPADIMSPGQVSPHDPSPPTSTPSRQPSVSSESSGTGGSASSASTPDVKEVTKAMSTIGIKTTGDSKTLRIPPRQSRGPTVGTLGRKIIVETNYLALNLKKTNCLVYHYDVSIKPDKPVWIYRKVVEHLRKKCFPNNFPAFDGKKNMYSFQRLPNDGELSERFNVWNEEKSKEEEYLVETKFATYVDMSSLTTYMKAGTSSGPPQDAIQALDVALRHPAALRCVQVGRSFFSPPAGTVVSLGDGLDLWHGIFQSAVLGWKPYLNIDIAHKGFPRPTRCLEALKEILKMERLPPENKELSRWELEDFKNFLKGLKIEYEIPGAANTKRTYKVDDVMSSAMKYRFEYEGKEICVGEYFDRVKRYKIRYLNLPLIIHAKKNAFPLELCTIKSGQVIMKKLSDSQTREMVRSAARPANERKAKILDALKSVQFGRDPCIREFGIEVSETFEKVPARILDAPQLKYGGRPGTEMIFPERGVWRPKQFLFSAKLEKWVILNIDYRTRDDKIEELKKSIKKKSFDLGMKVEDPCEIKTLQFKRNEDITRGLKDTFEKLKSQKVELVMVIIPDGGDAYGKVKKVSEVDVGILTQCVKARTVFKLSDTTVSNILLKVNAKLNGINHVLGPASRPKYFNSPVMVVGADVTHPSPDQKEIPSIAAVAASHDPQAFKYNMLWRLQPARLEIIQDFESIMKEQLMFFYKQTKQKPVAILFYRDGVSEGQFEQVLDQELQAMRRACKALESSYQPKITFFVVQKRHHTRFFPTRREDEDGKNRNVPAGTIVDTDITHPTELDFYLVSHASIQGTSRPTKYHRLWDDSDLSEDEVEQITYYLCHLFTRCTRTVSIPAPTYYAHLAAFRIRNYFDGRMSGQNLEQEQKNKTIQTQIIKGNPMFFV